MRAAEGILAAAVLLTAATAHAITAEEIMERVAANQDRSVEARKRWVYHEDELVRVHYSNGNLDSEERRQYTVTPTADGIRRTLISSERAKGDSDINLSNDAPHGRPSWFPLTRAEQEKYKFILVKEDTYRERRVWIMEFQPIAGAWKSDAIWAGEALIDQAEFQPVLMTIRLAEKLPKIVRYGLGTNVDQLGFKLTYRKLEDGVWMPESYGGEFKVKALFFISRRISLSVRNSDFRRTDVHSTFDYAEAPGQPF